jgi:hypothetical protein
LFMCFSRSPGNGSDHLIPMESLPGGFANRPGGAGVERRFLNGVDEGAHPDR